MNPIVDKLMLPRDVCYGAPLLHITGKYEGIIENYKSIIEYDENSLILNTKDGKIKITGDSLKIEYFNENDMKIKGSLKKIMLL